MFIRNRFLVFIYHSFISHFITLINATYLALPSSVKHFFLMLKFTLSTSLVVNLRNRIGHKARDFFQNEVCVENRVKYRMFLFTLITGENLNEILNIRNTP